MKISVIGTGYVGLVSGLCLAEKGHDVICVDIDPEKVEKINNAIPPIYEEGLEDLLKKNIRGGFSCTTNIMEAVLGTTVSFIAVGTPFDGQKIDLGYIRQAAADIGNVLRQKNEYHVVVVKSTVVPGTTDEIVLPILEKTSGKKAGKDFGVGMNPEFLKEGEAVNDFMNPDRIVLGGIDKRSIDVMDRLYSVFEGTDIVKTNNRTAEMIKYAANSLMATLISFSNEIGNLCSLHQDVDVVDVLDGVKKDRRFNPISDNGERTNPGFLTYLAAGCGFGGSCFPKDVKALVSYGKSVGNPMTLLDSVLGINADQPMKIIDLLHHHFDSISGRRITVLGLAFKPGTSDIRESPAIPVIHYLINEGADVHAYDPVATEEAEALFRSGKITYHGSLAASIVRSEAIILMTSWNEFRELPDLVDRSVSAPVIIDGRRFLPKDKFETYAGIGLQVHNQPH